MTFRILSCPPVALIVAAMIVVSFTHSAAAQSASVMKIGVIGLDTSHANAFANIFNAENATGDFAQQQITHAFPGGSEDIESSRSRVEGYTDSFRKKGITIVDSVDELVKQVDAVIVHSLDGRKHLAQVIPAFQAKKPVFIDKPLAGTLAEAIAIKMIAEKYSARWFTSSSLRYSAGTIQYREEDAKRKSVRGAIAWSPCSLEKTHPDLYWYGVHGVETLYTVMGKGCKQVSRVSVEGTDVALGLWSDGRVGEFRGIRDGKADYGFLVFGQHAIEMGGKYDGYAPLVDRVASFFKGEYEGVEVDESIEMFTFMEAADESKRQGGKPILLADVIAKATKEAEQLVKKHLPPSP
ncbi:Inositol 2-dehydrogenase/D-chiro-inositol 3-dehydrogenase [Pirellula sp. SH-Sr6A]|uniref:Gfo/Idh/MocA family protein n=1 Tax=Pirellula sp. SH-Sr6A TaxID=1632865 RepID=UPI00078EE056|nr:Gfo/Idh/MocA family oxidoreductase [Pirellula sp. SH-Sr6A]AMV35574.1 Inositol 2-dehydrogenase/D-chiro-inositol 3-dehydrogenase [Pirellula sp. SH-Sr6A]